MDETGDVGKQQVLGSSSLASCHGVF